MFHVLHAFGQNKKKRSVMKICDTLNPFSFYMYFLFLITVNSVSVESCNQWLEYYCLQIWNPRFGCETFIYSLHQCFLSFMLALNINREKHESEIVFILCIQLFMLYRVTNYWRDKQKSAGVKSLDFNL